MTTSPRRRSRSLTIVHTAAAAIAAFVLLALLPIRADATLQILQPDASTTATFQGNGGVSTDGLGQSGGGGTVQAEVPAGSTVVRAYLYGTYFFDSDPSLASRTIEFDGNSVVTTKLANSEPGPCCQLSTTRAEVTAIVAAKVGAGGGIFDFVIGNDPATLDGVALVVIYSNPASPEVTVAVLDGGSKQSGDQTTLTFAEALDPTSPGFTATMALGSGFSFQQGQPGNICGGDQFSTVDVNGERLTSCAGNFDDGFGANGGLITVGGVNDSTDNPADPNATNSGTDDELYNLVPFIDMGDTQLVLNTTNPSGDDNLFLSVITITAEAANVTTEVCDNNVDDDSDTLVDDDDPDCNVAPPPSGGDCPADLTPAAAAAAGYNVIEGTNAKNTLNGTSGDDAIYGYGANDFIKGNDGDDCIFAGDGNDYVTGGNGDDTAYGEGGSDKMDGNAGDDDLDGGTGSFSILTGGPHITGDRCVSIAPLSASGCELP